MRILLRRYWVALLALVGVTLIAVLIWPTPKSGGKTSPKKETTTAAGESKPLRLSADDARRAGLLVKRLEPAPAADAVELFGSVEVNKDRLARVVSPVAG